MEQRWRRVMAGMHAALEDEIPQDQPCMPAGDMGKLVRTDDIADRMNATVARAKLVVDLDAGAVGLDTGLGKIERLDVRRATGSDEQVTAVDCFRALHARDLDADAPVVVAQDPRDLRALAQRNSFLTETIEQNLRDLTLVLR